MEKETLECLLNGKLWIELQQFQAQMLRKEKEELYGNAYQIDTILNLYELLIEENKTEDQLESLLRIPDLLSFLSEQWMQEPDGYLEQMQEFLKKQLHQITQKQKTEKEGVGI